MSLFKKLCITHFKVKTKEDRNILFEVTINDKTFDCTAFRLGAWCLIKEVKTGKSLSSIYSHDIEDSICRLLDLNIEEWKS